MEGKTRALADGRSMSSNDVRFRPEADIGCRLPRAGQEMRRKLL